MVTNRSRSDKWLFGTMLAFGLVGLAMSLALSVERYIQLTQPGTQLICNINAIFNCGTVMQTWQAKVLGFPNSFIGIAAYPVVITVAVAKLAGAQFPRWFWRWAEVGFGAGLLFSYWLFLQSVFVIQVLCPLCLAVTVSTTVIYAALLHYNLRENVYNLPARLHQKIIAWQNKRYDIVATVAWLVALTAVVLIKFPDIF